MNTIFKLHFVCALLDYTEKKKRKKKKIAFIYMICNS